jgi:hypothetical protein
MPVRTRTGIHKTFTRTGAYDSAKIVKLSPCFVRLDDNLASTLILSGSTQLVASKRSIDGN